MKRRRRAKRTARAPNLGHDPVILTGKPTLLASGRRKLGQRYALHGTAPTEVDVAEAYLKGREEAQLEAASKRDEVLTSYAVPGGRIVILFIRG